jgi:hypothetical protein
MARGRKPQGEAPAAATADGSASGPDAHDLMDEMAEQFSKNINEEFEREDAKQETERLAELGPKAKAFYLAKRGVEKFIQFWNVARPKLEDVTLRVAPVDRDRNRLIFGARGRTFEIVIDSKLASVRLKKPDQKLEDKLDDITEHFTHDQGKTIEYVKSLIRTYLHRQRD